MYSHRHLKIYDMTSHSAECWVVLRVLIICLLPVYDCADRK